MLLPLRKAEPQKRPLTSLRGCSSIAGFLSPNFVTNLEEQTVEFENPYILINTEKISTVTDLAPIMEKTVQLGRSLFIIAEDVEGEALSTLVVNKLRGVIQVAAVKAPGFGDRRKEMLEDIAVLTGGQVISEESGIRLEKYCRRHVRYSAARRR